MSVQWSTAAFHKQFGGFLQVTCEFHINASVLRDSFSGFGGPELSVLKTQPIQFVPAKLF